MLPEAVYSSADMCLWTEEKSGKLQLGYRLIKAVRPVIASNVIPYPQLMSVESLSGSGCYGQGKNIC